jgi:CheY-like chemotaxis protein
MAVATVAPRISSIQPTVITSEEISRCAEITSQLSQLEAQQKALALMDIQMPELNGLEATKAIRAKERQTGKHLPIRLHDGSRNEG